MTTTEQTDDASSAEKKGQITPELVRQVADKVYELWQQALAIEQERQRLSINRRQ